MRELQVLFIVFMIYSVIGWIIEIIDIFIETKKVVNRGFLIGPYVPIYGLAAIVMTLVLEPFKESVVILFIMAFIICSILEYITSYIMEKMFKARWWDYREKLFNINGRICLENSLLFGLAGVLLIEIIDPFIFNSINIIPNNIIFIVSLVLMIIFITDLIISYLIINNIRKLAFSTLNDSTEEIGKLVRSTVDGKLETLRIDISEELKKIISNKHILYKRLLNSFPNLQIGKNSLEKIKQAINSKKKKLSNTSKNNS